MEHSTSVVILTIGHSTHSWDRFLSLLRGAGVTAVADVRTVPFSRHTPQFNCDALKLELGRAGIAYSFLGKELGGRPDARELYCGGVADYEKMARSNAFKRGLDRVLDGAQRYRVALMCSEQDPLDCHRCLLIGRALAERGMRVEHILSDEQIVEHSKIENQLLNLSGLESNDLFDPRDERLAIAYRNRARKVAFIEPKPEHEGPVTAE